MNAKDHPCTRQAAPAKAPATKDQGRQAAQAATAPTRKAVAAEAPPRAVTRQVGCTCRPERLQRRPRPPRTQPGNPAKAAAKPAPAKLGKVRTRHRRHPACPKASQA